MINRIRLTVVVEGPSTHEELHQLAIDALIEHGPYVSEDEGMTILPSRGEA